MVSIRASLAAEREEALDRTARVMPDQRWA